MKWFGFVLCFCITWQVSAVVSLSQKGENFILKNDFLEAEIAPDGGRISRLVNKINGQNMVTDRAGKATRGGARDRLIPSYLKLISLKHKLRIVKNTPQEAILQTFVRGTDAHKFIELTKTYTLKKDSPRLDIRVELRNTPESMGETELTYSSHNFYGVPNADNMVYIPMPDGIKRFLPSEAENKKYNNIPARGWIAVIGPKNAGAVSMFDLTYNDIVYSWYCPGEPLHSVEWQMKAMPVPAGETYTIRHAIALSGGLSRISGAGSAAVGEILIPATCTPGTPVKVTVRLFGLERKDVTLKLAWDKNTQKLNCKLTPGKITEYTVTLPAPANTHFVTCEVLDKKGVKLLDLYEKVQIADKALTLEMADYPVRKKIAANADVWDIPLDKKLFNEPTEFQWGRNSAYKSLKTIALIPTMGVRDIMELSRRTKMEVTFPTIFPGSWQMAWRDKVLRPGETGVGTLPQYVKKPYDLYVIGGSFSAKGDAHLSWNKIPASVRAKILNAVKNGASLLYINPDGLDPQMTKLLAALDQGQTAKKLLASFDLKAAPAFDKTQIRCGNYGKGKIITIKFPVEKAFLTPSFTKWVNGYNLFVEHRYDYQDYQFAVLAKLVQYLAGAPATPAITLENEIKNNILEYKCVKDATTIQYAVYNRYGDKLASQTVPANGKLVLPQLPAGENRIKLCVLDKNGKVIDFTFKTVTNPAKSILKDITWAKLPIHAGDHTIGEVKLSGALPADAVVQVEISDIMGRLLQITRGTKVVFNTAKSRVLTHLITVKILKNGAVTDLLRKNFHVVGAGQENYYPTMLWVVHTAVPDYLSQQLMNLSADYGFSLQYGGFPNKMNLETLQYSPVEVSANTFAGLHGGLHNPQVKKLITLPKEQKIRNLCMNDPAVAPRQQQFVKDALNLLKNYGSERYFNMGDEMSITYYSTPIDICFSKHCLPEFRKFLMTIYPSLDELNKHWETNFKSWNDVMPMTFDEVMTRENAAPWSTHREFMDRLFANNVNMQADVIRKVYPNGYYGPTGLEGKPHVYGGGTNFEHMRKLTMLSAYGDARIPLSFDRKKRMIMCYRGYKRTELSQFINYWEGLFAGERGANHWYTWSFFQPDGRSAEKREFFRKHLWDLRSGLAALMVNSDKFTDEAAILYSQPSARSNFLKTDKMEVFDNLISFARYFEDRAMGYRFILPADLENGTLNKFKLLVLPESTAMSAKQAQAIRNFVKNGGVLLADYETALEDEWNVPLAKGMLDDLLGIRQRSMGFANAAATKERNIRKVAKAKAVKGKINGSIKDQLNRQYPILITNQYGKGRTLYLNFRFEYAKQRESGDSSLRYLLDQHLNMKQKFTPVKTMNGKSAGLVMTTFYHNGANTYIGLLPGLPAGNWQKAKPDDLKKLTYKVKFTLPGKGHLYNARTGKYYGTNPVRIMNMTPAHAMLLSLLPYKVTALDVKADKMTAKPGDIIKLKTAVKVSGGKAGHHVFHMTVKTPDGKTPWYYRQTQETQNGIAEFALPIALNDPVGSYEITITDAATKTTEKIRIACKQ